MAFGDLAQLISNFNGVDENPLSENGVWTNKVVTTDSNMRRVSGQCGAAGNAGSAWWNTRTVGPTLDAYYTLTQKPGTNNDWWRLFIRLQAPGTAGVDGYFLQYVMLSGADSWDIYRLTNGSPASILNGTQEIANGDRFGLAAAGNLITLYWDSGNTGVWAQLGSVTDNTYLTAGFVGLGSASSVDTRMDDFYAGDTPNAAGVKTRLGWPGMTR